LRAAKRLGQIASALQIGPGFELAFFVARLKQHRSALAVDARLRIRRQLRGDAKHRVEGLQCIHRPTA
jgi:hypothetical protein